MGNGLPHLFGGVAAGPVPDLDTARDYNRIGVAMEASE